MADQITGSILIVDDTPDNIRLLAEMLSKQGHKVRPADSGSRALTTIEKEAPDLILLDSLFNSADDEHPDCWIECGSDDGPLDSIAIHSSGYAIHTQYADADMVDENFSERIDSVDKAKALELWRKLIVR